MTAASKVKIRDLSFSYNQNMVLHHNSVDLLENQITAITGPSGSGKSTLLMTLNRLWEAAGHGFKAGTIEIKFADKFYDIYSPEYPVTKLRRQVGMVFQTPNPLPISIYKNVALPLKLAGDNNAATIKIKVEEALKMAGLWGEVCNRLDAPALELSGGQQQRLCIARAMILQPEILLLDEPTSSLDHQATATIEELLVKLKNQCTIVMVSHYRDQVQRIADRVIELRAGRIIRNLSENE
ncbi:MAG: phosphate ABC transporter ATP-binding protein [Thermodesulfobacteriota bacterium]|nr:phosphate ABC transporter ATP-binding protein [Thermodesulfobacteriota bacterium]